MNHVARSWPAFALAAVVLASQAGAQTPQISPTPASISDATIAQLKGGRAKEAINVFFGDNPLVKAKSGEFTMLESQITSAITVYGPIHACEFTQSTKSGTLVEYRLYLCQHDHVVTRWRFLYVRGVSGWAGYNFSFDDKPQLTIDQP